VVGVRQLPGAPSKDALLLEADEPSVADDHVVQEVDAEELASLSFTSSGEAEGSPLGWKRQCWSWQCWSTVIVNRKRRLCADANRRHEDGGRARCDD